MIVMKFGGTSVGTATAVAQTVSIIRSSAARRPTVVVSALFGVTDALIDLADRAARGEIVDLDLKLAALAERHEAMAKAVAGEKAADCVERLNGLFIDLGHVLRGIAFLRELSERSRDLIVSFGERLSAPVVAAAVRAAGCEAAAVDAREIIETDDHFGNAAVNFARTDEKIRSALRPIVEAGAIPVVTGFIGATEAGVTTTLGRGGSDYSAAIVGAALGAEEIWIWKEVDGVMTADPSIVSDAALLPLISYDEAAEMSYFGAKVLHPKTMIPAVERGIPIRLRNTFRPAAPGTIIGGKSLPAPDGVKVVASIKKLSMVTIEGKGMAGMAGFAAAVFAVAGRARINVVMFMQSSSEQNICLVIAAKDGTVFRRALEEAFADAIASKTLDSIRVEEGVAAVAAVGEGMRGVPGVAARVFAGAAEAGVNLLAIAQGSSERNISFVVRESEADAAVRAVHRACNLHLLAAPVAV